MNPPPTLLESGAAEHLKTTLAECRHRRYSYVSYIVNILLVFLLLGVMWLVYKYKNTTGPKRNDVKQKGIQAERSLMALLNRSGSRIAVQNNMSTW